MDGQLKMKKKCQAIQNNNHRPSWAESGQIIVIYAVALVATLVLVAIAYDLGGAFVTYQRATTATQAAAFAAAQQIDMAEFYSTNEVKIDPSAAAATAGQYASLNNEELAIVSIGVYDDHVVVVSQMAYQSFFADAIGFGSIESEITAIGYPAYGIDDKGQ
jgi:Flp pilus assembly protein TadG